MLPNKTRMLDFLLEKIDFKSNEKILIFELGIAFGEATKYTKDNLKGSFEYYGLDTLNGLSKKGKGLSKRGRLLN